MSSPEGSFTPQPFHYEDSNDQPVEYFTSQVTFPTDARFQNTIPSPSSRGSSATPTLLSKSPSISLSQSPATTLSDTPTADWLPARAITALLAEEPETNFACRSPVSLTPPAEHGLLQPRQVQHHTLPLPRQNPACQSMRIPTSVTQMHGFAEQQPSIPNFGRDSFATETITPKLLTASNTNDLNINSIQNLNINNNNSSKNNKGAPACRFLPSQIGQTVLPSRVLASRIALAQSRNAARNLDARAANSSPSSFISFTANSGKSSPALGSSGADFSFPSYGQQNAQNTALGDVPRQPEPSGVMRSEWTQTPTFDVLPEVDFVPKKMPPDLEKSLDNDLWYLYRMLLPSEELVSQLRLLLESLQNMVDREWPGTRRFTVYPFGSAVTQLCTRSSDLDVCFTSSSNFNLSCAISDIVSMLMKNGICEIDLRRASARVPVVRFVVSQSRLSCDINVNNVLALHNTIFTRRYIQMHPLVRPLMILIKFWTQRRALNNAAAGSLSNYCWIILVIYFLQVRGIVPTLPLIQINPEVATWEASPQRRPHPPIPPLSQLEISSPPAPVQNYPDILTPSNKSYNSTQAPISSIKSTDAGCSGTLSSSSSKSSSSSSSSLSTTTAISSSSSSLASSSSTARKTQILNSAASAPKLDHLTQDTSPAKANENATLAHLFYSFLRFIAFEFDTQESFVGVRNVETIDWESVTVMVPSFAYNMPNQLLRKTLKFWARSQLPDLEYRPLCVEDPLNPLRNLSNNASDATLKDLRLEMWRALFWMQLEERHYTLYPADSCSRLRNFPTLHPFISATGRTQSQPSMPYSLGSGSRSYNDILDAAGYSGRCGNGASGFGPSHYGAGNALPPHPGQQNREYYSDQTVRNNAVIPHSRSLLHRIFYPYSQRPVVQPTQQVQLGAGPEGVVFRNVPRVPNGSSGGILLEVNHLTSGASGSELHSDAPQAPTTDWYDGKRGAMPAANPTATAIATDHYHQQQHGFNANSAEQPRIQSRNWVPQYVPPTPPTRPHQQLRQQFQSQSQSKQQQQQQQHYQHQQHQQQQHQNQNQQQQHQQHQHHQQQHQQQQQQCQQHQHPQQKKQPHAATQRASARSGIPRLGASQIIAGNNGQGEIQYIVTPAANQGFVASSACHEIDHRKSSSSSVQSG